MARPPNNSSAWHHHDDTFRLMNPNGNQWLGVTTPVDRSRISVTVPCIGDAHSASHVLEVRTDSQGHVVCLPLYSSDPARRTTPVRWTRETAVDTLLPRDRGVRARHSAVVDNPADGIVAFVHADQGGRLFFKDTGGRIRLELRLHPDAPPPGRMRLVAFMKHSDRSLVDVYAVDDPNFPIGVVQSSQP